MNIMSANKRLVQVNEQIKKTENNIAFNKQAGKSVVKYITQLNKLKEEQAYLEEKAESLDLSDKTRPFIRVKDKQIEKIVEKLAFIEAKIKGLHEFIDNYPKVLKSKNNEIAELLEEANVLIDESKKGFDEFI